jgi:hypothetical protein
MNCMRFGRSGLAILALGWLSACASNPGTVLPDDTLLLGEVSGVMTRGLLGAGRLSESDAPRDLSRLLQNRGWTEEQVDGGRVLVLRVQIYWNNTASGVLRDQLSLELLADGLSAEVGNVVEFTAGARTGRIERVRARSLQEGGCYYGNVAVGPVVELLAVPGMVGPRGSASLYCRGIEREGWQRPRTLWHRLPGAAAVGEVAPFSPPSEVPLPK